MTEKEWLKSSKLWSMLKCAHKKTSDRKWQLFGCACCRRIWDLIGDEDHKRVIEMAEQYADGLISEDNLRLAKEAAYQAYEKTSIPPAVATIDWVRSDATLAVWRAAGNTVASPFFVAYGVANASTNATHAAKRGTKKNETTAQANLLRCIVGNPFRLVTFNPQWLTATLQQLAALIYEERQFDKMPLLGDALEEAGCDNEDILKHCRGGGEHVRGCFALDLVLGKE